MVMKKKICFITNIGPHYRYPIYNQIGKTFNCDFYIGDHVTLPIKKFDYNSLTGYKKTLKNIFFNNFYWQRGVIRLVKMKYDYFIITGEPYCLSSWLILILLKLKGTETIAWTHGWYGREKIMKKIIKKIYFSLFSKLLLYSEYAINLMRNEGFNESKMYCIANSLDSDKNKIIRSTLKLSNIYISYFKNNYPVIIYCGRIQKWKRLELLIDCVALLKNEEKIVNVIIVGKDVDNVNIDKYANEKGISKQLWMYGPCYDDYILGELFYNASVCVSPGNVGLTAIHALSFGCPVISHNNFKEQCPEFEAIKPGVTGDFFCQNDVVDMKMKIKKWISIDVQARNKVHEAAFHEIDSKWNIHHQIDVLRNVLCQ